MVHIHNRTKVGRVAPALAILLGSSAFCTHAAFAQSNVAQATTAQNDSRLADIVVTAQKRNQNLQEVGISVTAVGAEQLQAYGISSSGELARRVAGVDISSPFGSGTSANVVIRGIGLADFGDGNEAPVTAYVDEFYLVSVPATDFALFDIDQVEVLRGPQGTLFGRNSTGGLINYRTVKPGDTFAGNATASYGTFNEMKFEGGVTIPVSDTLSTRFSVISHHDDGYVKNLYPGSKTGGQVGTDALRGQLRYKNADWDILYKGEYGWQDANTGYLDTSAAVADPVTGLFLSASGPNGFGYDEATTAAAPKNVVNANSPNQLRAQATTHLLRIERDLGDTTISSITGYQWMKRTYQEDSDGSPNSILTTVFPYRGSSLTQELRLFHSGERVKLTAGAYGLWAKSKAQPSGLYNFPLTSPPTVDGDGLYNGDIFPLELAANWRQATQSYSGFIQAEVLLNSAFSLLVGGRVTHDRKRFSDYDNASLRLCPGGDGGNDTGTVGNASLRLCPGGDGGNDTGTVGNCLLVSDGGSGIAQPFSQTYRKTLYSGKIELDYKPSDDVLLYASVSRGTKGGGFNNGFYLADLPLDKVIYRDETLYSYEIGEKIELLDKKLRVNGALFYYDYKNYQSYNFFITGGFLGNNDATAYGGEIEIEYSPVRALNFQLGAAWLETKLKNVVGPEPTYVADRQLANAPHWSVNGAVTYKQEFLAGRYASATFSFDAKGKRYNTNYNDPGALLESYFKCNFNLSVDVTDKLTAGAYVRNITNVQNTVLAGGDSVYYGFRYAQPRTAGGTLSYRW